MDDSRHLSVRFGIRRCVRIIDALGQHQHFGQHPANRGFHAIQRYVWRIADLAIGNENNAREKVKQNQEQIVNNDTDAMFGRRRGVIASLLNSFESGSLVVAIVDAVNSVIHNGGISIAVPIILSFAVYIFIWLFIQETYRVVMMRMLLEGRSYDKLPASRFLYPIHTHAWPRIAWTMFVENVFLFLWSLTIIGFFIKQYSYRMVPYIIAENPNIKALDAIRLSRHMMKGINGNASWRTARFLAGICSTSSLLV